LCNRGILEHALLKTSAFLISNNAEGRSDFLLKNRGSGYNIQKLEHASQDFGIIDLQY
jgi:hypothetical protein